MNLRGILTVALSCLCLEVTAADTKIDFNRDIRPILSDQCYQCHGPDENQREADLRLVMKHLEAFIETVQDGLDQADWPTRRAIIHALIKRIEIHEDDIRIVYRVTPPDPLQNTQRDISHYCSRQATLACG